MSRTIERFARFGYITKADGQYYRILVSENGTEVIDRHMFGRNRSAQQINAQVAQIGGDAPPSARNGWDVMLLPGQCPNHPREYVLKDRLYERKFWKAYTSTGDASKWQGTEIGTTEAARNTYCGLTVNKPTLGDKPPLSDPAPTGDWSSTPIIEGIDWRIAVAVGIVVLMVVYGLMKK